MNQEHSKRDHVLKTLVRSQAFLPAEAPRVVKS